MFRTLITLSLVMGCFALHAQDDILDARTNYDIDDEVTVTGIVTNDDGLGSVRYIQDESAAIAIYPGFDWDDWTEPMPGDEITVTGVLTEFNGLLEVGPDLSAVTINSSGNPLPDFQVVTPDALGEDLEGELITIENCIFSIGGGCEGSGGAPTIEGNTTYSYTANGEVGVIYVRSTNPLVGTVLPAGEVTVHGILSQFSFTGFDGYQLLPRDSGDIETTSSINLASAITQDDIATDSFTVEWITDIAGTSQVDYGLTMDLGTTLTDETMTTDHSVTLDGLEPGNIYFIQVSSSADPDVAQSTIQPFATKSNSSGAIRVYFNGDVDNSVATIEQAVSIGADMNDTIAHYIANAQHTLDIAAYNINNSVIVDAINEANANGVEIRYIAQGTNLNSGIGDFDAGIAVHYREDDMGSGMHNKFVIADADYEDLATVLTGSTNFTTGNLVDDFNNLVIVEDQSLAKGYRLEFEEMWGGSGSSPDEENARFGADKTKNTPVNYIIGDVPVELYFSPTDGTTSAIECALLDTDADCDFALLALTRDELAEAIISVTNIFVQPRGVIEQTSGTGNEYQTLLDGGVDVWSHEGISPQVHHKYCTIDHSNGDSDPTVITGSHNWSSSAESFNDENTLFIHDERVANLYHQEFMAIYNSLTSVEEMNMETVLMYPNPTDRYLNISILNSNDQRQYQIVDMKGSVVFTGQLRNGVLNTLDLNEVVQGFYVISVPELGWSQQFIKR